MTPLFEVRNLSAGYQVPLVQNITFSAHAGEIIGILGRNGCGKTTLLRGISGSIRRFSGEILVAGHNCTAISAKDQAVQISVLHQQTEILAGLSPRQIIAMGRYPHSSLFHNDFAGDRIRQYAALLGISHLLDTDCAKLSQGQRQMVLLCRVLVQDTPVMLLDEPNAALDYDNTDSLFCILREIVQKQGKTALLVLHDPELALAQCHRLLILKDGKLCRDVSLVPADLAAAEEALQQIYPNIILRKDPFDGHLRCYPQSEVCKE